MTGTDIEKSITGKCKYFPAGNKRGTVILNGKRHLESVAPTEGDKDVWLKIGDKYFGKEMNFRSGKAR